jgi:ABC-type transporter Mla subunit MlaD
VTFKDVLTSTQRDIASTSDKAGRALERLDSAVAEVSPELKRLMRELHVSLGEVKKTMGAAQKTLATATSLINTTQGDTTKLLVSLRDLSGSLQRSTQETLAGLQRLVAHVDEVVARNDRNLYSSVESLRDTAENLKAASRQVRTNPSVLLWGTRGRQEPDALNASDATTRALQDRGRVGRYDRLQ